MNQKEQVFKYIEKAYNTLPEYPWADENAVFRHSENRKWFAIIMEVKKEHLKIKGEGKITIMNVKASPLEKELWAKNPSVLPAYHMNKTHWLSIALNGTLPNQTVYGFLERSFNLTK